LTVFYLGSPAHFPDPERADPDGLLAIGGDLSRETLLEAYRQGIFPWYSDDNPLLWWSPPQRFVLFPNQLRINRSLRQFLKNHPLHLTCDLNFSEVIARCASTPRPGQEGTWITREMRQAFVHLHLSGIAHSVEVRLGTQLVGGLYGIHWGPFFFGESMFYRLPFASKLALVFLAHLFRDQVLIDCQMPTPHLEKMGATLIPRAQFLGYLASHPQPSPTWQELLEHSQFPWAPVEKRSSSLLLK
jgi:leucyl/phenylalanyl-tRNA--protein transferase